MSTTSFSIDSSDLSIRAGERADTRLQQLPKELGDGHSMIMQVDQGLNFIDTRYIPSKNFSIVSRMELIEPQIVVTLGLKGYSCFQEQRGKRFDFAENYITITSFDNCLGERRYPAGKTLHQLRFVVGRSWLERYFGEEKTACLFSSQQTKLHHYHQLSSACLLMAGNIASCHTSPQVSKLYLHGQILNLLANELESLLNNTLSTPNYLSHKDKFIAEKAREILYAEFKNPPSIFELARRVGTNTFKLKSLFHQNFQTSPYALVIKFRMQHAYELLVNEGIQISLVADRVGYLHPGNFSAAFSRYFGVTPKTISKSKKLGK